MSTVELVGGLVCEHDEQVRIVRRHLPRYIELTRAEPGYLHFDVEQTVDPLVWTVSETFVSQAAFDAHHARVGAGDWGRATAGIKRDL
ncbi:antibiotic biosynthesis monooxygenase [Citricoccus sp. NPDC055426]|uniref:putative quinol monooxygenase n=1 Tax=Citricoccus sp. NPDC055426 TaxID=3155536 RepID=UPI003434B582